MTNQRTTEKMGTIKTQKDKSRWLILFAVVMSTFMATLDASIVNVALPVMADALQTTTASIARVVSVYLITIAATILIFGKLGDLFGQTKIFKIGIAVFTAGSLLCGITDSFGWLLAARVIQAVGAGGTMANSQGIITRTFSSSGRGRALGVNGAFVALGTLTGPPLGGLIVSIASWKYLFWINVPIGIIVFLIGLRVFPKPKKKPERKQLDIHGTLLFILGIVPLFIALQASVDVGFGNIWILLCIVVSAISFVMFYRVEKHADEPLLPLGIFKNKWFGVSLICAFLSFIAIFISTNILPFYLQHLLQLTPATAGLILAIFPLVLGAVSPVSGHLSDKIGSDFLTLLGLSVTSAGLFLMSTLSASPSFLVLGIFIAVMALGNGLFQAPNNSLVMSSLEEKNLGIGGSVNALVRNIGMVVGLSMAIMILYGGMSSRLGYAVNNYTPGADNEAFLFGMHLAYITAALVCAAGAVLTAWRMRGRHKGINGSNH
jgi:EmrB/QacA subfamily drug resistance transporter